MTTILLGSGKWENTVFNPRLQPTNIGLGNGVNSQNLLKLQYGYGTTANNGNIVSQTITVPGVFHDLVQSYTYDEPNRLTNAELIKNSVQQWEQTFTYDRFGNRNFNESLTTTLPKGCVDGSTAVVCEADKKMLNPDLNASDNRMAAGQGWSYDAAGNVIADPQGRSFICEVGYINGVLIADSGGPHRMLSPC